MKKILALTLALIFALSLCACGSTGAGGTNETPTAPAGNSDPTDGASASTDTPIENNDPTDGADTGYVGTWKAIAPDSNPFPPITVILNEDGTGSWGTKADKMEPRFWYDSEDDDAKEGQIEIAREDTIGYGHDAYITEDGKLYVQINITVGDNTYDHILFEKQ